MIHSSTVLATEEDVRSKVVMSWLSLHGFAPADILVERSFELRVGRSVFRVGESSAGEAEVTRRLRPRTDVLVRHVDGRNLLVVEVKAPGEPLDEEAREQGISYARLLRQGGIAPFVVLTDGLRTRIFDSVSGEAVACEGVPGDHRHARSGFRVTGEHSGLRAEALEKLVSLDPDNLAAFCRGQVEFRLRKLRDTDPQSGRKYIPGLYVERPKAQDRLDSLIAEGRRVVLIVGPPQVGKTNLVCHSVEQRLERGEPTLFYPAIAVGGLAAELRDDFEWTLRQGAGSDALAADRLARVARASGRRVVIFVDGWNEAAVEAARSIDAAAARIASDQVTFVISMTNVAARRLLTDAVGDPAFVADEAGIPLRDLAILELRTHHVPKGWSVVALANYDANERDEAYARYAAALNVRIPPGHRYTDDPLLLRSAMLVHSGGTLPLTLDDPAFLGRHIDTKLSRARLRDPSIGRPLLVSTAEELLAHGAPARQDRLLARWGIALHEGIPRGLLEAALLVQRGGDEEEARMDAEDAPPADGVDFYLQRERDYVIAYWARRWNSLLEAPEEEIASTLAAAVATEVGRSALEWFLRQLSNRPLVQRAWNLLGTQGDSRLRRVLVAAVFAITNLSPADAYLLDAAVRAGLKDPDSDVRLETTSVLAELLEDDKWDDLRAVFAADREIVRDLLRFHRDHPFHVDAGVSPALDALHTLHAGSYNSWADFDWDTPITEHLAVLAEDPEVGEAALLAFAYLAPHPFMSWLDAHLASQGVMDVRPLRLHRHALANATFRMHEVLYTAFEREGALIDALRDRYPGNWGGTENMTRRELVEEHCREYREFRRIYEPIIRRFSKYAAGEELRKFLTDLQPEEDCNSVEEDCDSIGKTAEVRSYVDPAQLGLDLGGRAEEP